jgi:predicted ATPase/class 3 adenylate cyclase/DNA-binding CsgD family transcriptional regulator
MWAEAALKASTDGGPLSQLPTGTVTFLLSDIEGSTRLWSEHPGVMPEAVSAVYAIFDEAVARHEGVRPVEQGEGDSVVAAFSRASDSLAAAFEVQRALHTKSWADGMELRVRISLHTAEAQLRDAGNYFGIALSRCARIRAIAPGGHTLLSHATHDLVADCLPDGAELLDCGEHRLRDLGRPERIFALVHPELHALEPALLRSLDAVPNNLPGQLSSFVGRERELEELRPALGATRLLTLAGAGGSGKTRLALALASESLEKYPDGVWWIDLAAQADPAMVGDAIAEPIGVRPLPGMTPVQALSGALAQGRTLVVLDNCEHLLEACAEAATAILESCPGVTALATSRAPLGVPGESAWRVPALALPQEPAREPVESLSQYDAVKLFIERAMKARSNFAVTNDNAPAVAQICVDLDGIPLAIELAAARVRMLSIEQIAAGLADRFHLLTGGARSALPRHQTLRASVDWSHDLLSDQERVLFRRLGAFAGGFTLDAAEQVCADDQLDRYAILDLLTALVDKSLVLTVERGPAVRYGMLETVRQYAVQRLEESGEHRALRDRHLKHFAALAGEAEPALGAAGSDRWMTILDHEAPNMASALEHALATDPPAAMRIAVAHAIYWVVRGRMTEAEAAYSAVLVAVPESSALRARALWGRAWNLLHGAGGELAVALAEEALALAEQFGDLSTAARALDVIGAVQIFTDPASAVATVKRGAELARQAGDDWALGTNLLDTALALLMQEREPESMAAFEAAYPVNARIEYGENLCYHWWGTAYFGLNTGDRAHFRAGAERCREMAAELGEPNSWGSATAGLALDDADHGLAEAALEEAREAMAHLVSAGAGLALPFVSGAVAYSQAALGMLDAADETLRSLAAQGPGLTGYDQWTYPVWANVSRLSGDLEKADAHASKALELATFVGSDSSQATAKLAQGRIAAARGEYAAAEAKIHEAIAVAVPRGFRPLLADALAGLALVAAGLESYEEALRLLGASDRALEALDGRTRWKDEQAQLDALRERLESELGPEPYAEGRELSLENAIGWAHRARGQRKRPERGWESLTPTELRVVELVAEGLTNPQIGERMFISRGTVKVHLSHIFAKLGTATRAELAAEATRRGVPTSDSATA